MPQRKIVRSLNEAMLTRVLANLMNNALKYSDGDLEICLKDTGDILFINTASGLDQVQVARLFDRFYTVHHADNATGLGLEIARSLLERMHGSISAGCASVYGCQKLQRKHIPCESLATGESTCRGFQKTVL